jgi:hypothetical protein
MDAIAGIIATVVLLLLSLGMAVYSALWMLCKGLQVWEWAADRWEWARPRAMGPLQPDRPWPRADRPVELTFDGWLAAATELTFQEWVEVHSRAPAPPLPRAPIGGTGERWMDPSMAALRAEFHRLLADDARGAQVITGTLRSSVPYAGAIDPPPVYLAGHIGPIPVRPVFPPNRKVRG